MRLRRLLGERICWHYARRWVLAAESAELMVELSSDPATQAKFARNALVHYERALRWRSLDDPSQIPPPSEEPNAPAAPKGREMVPCVICSTPIIWPLATDPEGSGLYCERCKA